jgi:hypothetical protein
MHKYFNSFCYIRELNERVIEIRLLESHPQALRNLDNC